MKIIDDMGYYSMRCSELENEILALKQKLEEAKQLLHRYCRTTGHDHWDSTMQGGGGCELCKCQRELGHEIDDFLRKEEK